MTRRGMRARWEVRDLGWAYLVSEKYKGVYAGSRNLNRFVTSLFELYLGKRIRFYTAQRLRAYALISKEHFCVEAACIAYHKRRIFLFCIGKPEHFFTIARVVGADKVMTVMPIPTANTWRLTSTDTPSGKKPIYIYDVPNPITGDLRI